MIIEISVAVIAVAFAALVIYLIMLMVSLRDNLRQTKKILENTNDISLDLRNKMESLDPIFHTITNLGDVLEKKTESLKEYVNAPVEVETSLKKERELKKISDVLEFAGMGIRLWQKLKRR